LKELTRQKSALENELRKAREGGVSRSLLPSLDLPEPRGRLPIAEELMAPALLAWDCAQTFNDKLSLCRYSFDAVWKSNFGRPTPSTRHCRRDRVGSTAWRLTKVHTVFLIA
jgi:hypothetical protein